MPGPASAPPPGSRDGFSFVGNLLCVDFVNTEAVSHGGTRGDRLAPVDGLRGWGGARVTVRARVDDLLRWARAAALVDDAGLRRIPPTWRSSRDAARLLEDAK